MDKEERALLKRRYKLALELVQLLREHSFYLHVQCPRCGIEGTLSVLETSHYTYLVVRHATKRTHTIPLSQVNEVLCKIEQNIAQILTLILELYKLHGSPGGAGAGAAGANELA